MFVTAYTPPKINWPGSRSSVQSRNAAALQAQPELRAPPLVRDRMESVCNAPLGPQIDSHAARQTQAQVDPAPALQARPSWLYRQCMQPGERKHATFPIVRAFAARIDANVQSVRNLGKGSTPRARIDSNALAAPSQRPSSLSSPQRPTPTSPAAQPVKLASSRIAPHIKKARAPLGPQAGKASAMLKPANQATAPLASHVVNATAAQNHAAAACIAPDRVPLPHAPSTPLRMPPPMPVAQKPASLSRSSSCSSQSSVSSGLLEALRNHPGVQGLKKRTSEHNAEGKSSAETPPDQIRPRPVNGQRVDQPVYLELVAALKKKVCPSGTEHIGPGKVLFGSQESLPDTDSGHDSPPPSPKHPAAPVAMNPAARNPDGAYSRFGVWHSFKQLEVLNQIAVTLGPRRGESGA